MNKLITGSFLILALTQLSFAQRTQQMTAADILARVASVYSSCHAYSDEGKVSTKFNIAFSTPMIYRFSTAFVRPAAFRFELHTGVGNKGSRYVAWKAGDLEKAGWPIGVRHESIDEALLGLFGASQGSSLTVPALLFPGLFHGQGLFASLAELKLNGNEKVDGHRAFKIEAALQDEPFKLWIDTSQFLVLKIVFKSKVGNFEQETTIKYRPLLNVEVSPAQLAFNPPSGVGENINSSAAAGSESNAPTSIEDAPRLREFGSSLRQEGNKTIDQQGQEKNRRTDDEDVVRVDTDLVVCDTLVVDSKGRPISGLVKDDFIVKEDNQTQELGSFSLGNSESVPRSIVLILDYNASQLPYIITSVEAAKTLVDKLNPRDRMALVTDDVKLLVDFTSDKGLLKAKLDSLKARAMSGWLGRSKQYDALMATMNELFSREDLRPIIIFQTDGDQLEDLYTTERPALLQPYVPVKRFTFDDLLTTAERTGATVYSIIPGVSFLGLSQAELLKQAKADWENRQKADAELRRLNNIPNKTSYPTMSDEGLIRYAEGWTRLHLALAGVAKVTGGWADFLEQPEQANELYTHVLDDINKRYVIGYYPTNRTRDGKRRRVSIEVRGHPEYIVVGRKTYFAPQP